METSDTEAAVEQVVEVLGRVPLFRGLPRSDLERIADLAKPRDLEEGELLFREGDPGDRFYIVFSGSVEILKERPMGDHERLAVRRPGEAFGEMSLLNDAPRSASVKGLETTRLLAVSKQDFDELLGGESLAVRIMRGLARALRALDVRFASRGTDSGGSSALGQFSRLVHRGLLPRHPPILEDWEIAAGSAVDDEAIGASYWDGLVISERVALLAVMDVKGTGLPPAYLLGVTRALLRTVGGEEDAFEELLTRLNHATHENLFEGVDECVECGVLRLSPEGVSWSGAGDQPAVVIRVSGETEELKTHGPPLAILPRFEYGTTRVDLAQGDIVLAFSEADQGIIRGAVDLINARRDSGLDAIAGMLRSALLKAADAHGRRQDVSFFMVRKP